MRAWPTGALRCCRVGSGRVGSGRVGSGRVGSGRVGSGRVGSAILLLPISVATLINHKGWVFEGVHNSYTVALVAVTRCSAWSPASTPSSGPSTGSTAATPSPSSPSASSTREPSPGGGLEGDPDEPYVAIYPGPAGSLAQFRAMVDGKPELVPVSEFTRWSNTAAFPQIPTRPAFRVWRKIKRHPRFDGADLNESPDDLSLSLSLSESPKLEIPTSPGRRQLHERQVKVRQGRRAWGFHPVSELHSTHDRFRFVNDDGVSAPQENSTPPTTGADS